MATKFISAICIFLLASTYSFSQDSLSVKDAQEIRYKSESLIKRELQDLLNNISQPGYSSKETEEIIGNSYAGRDKIFESEKTRIESDLNPKIHSSNAASDIDVVKYLKDFDILYTKTDNFSIAFSDIKASQVKKATYLYVKVYFSSFFNNKFKGVEGETAYALNNRVAEIKVVNDNNKWMPHILRISYFEPGDTLSDIINDIVLKKEPGQLTNNGMDSLTAASIDAEIAAAKRQQLIADENEQMKRFSGLINDGDKALGENSFTDALNYYRQAKELMPYDPLPRSKISKANRLRESMNITKEQLFEEYKGNARLAVRKREYEDAIRLFRLALDNKPTEKSNLQPEIDALTKKQNFLTEMNLNYKAGNYKEAIKQYTAAIKKQKDSDYFLERAKSYTKTGEYSDAMNDYTSAYALDNENLAAIEGRADLHKFLGDGMTKSKQTGEKKEHYIKALTDYSAYITINRKNQRVYEMTSELQMLLYNNIDDAIKPLDAGIEADSKAENLYLKKGLLLMQKNDYRKANINFSTVLTIDSNAAFAYYNRGVCQLTFNNIQSAAEDFKNARQKGLDSLNTKNINAYAVSFFQRSENYFKANMRDSAIKMIDDALAIDPGNSVYHYTRGEYYSSIGNYKEAITSYDKAIDVNSSYTDAYYKRGSAYYAAGNYKSALENLGKASVAGYERLYLVQKGTGDAYFASAEYNKASQSFEKAIKTAASLKKEPSDEIVAEMYNSLGKSYFNQNTFDESIEACKNAIKRNGALAEAYFNRGMAYSRSGKLKDAIDDIEKAISLDGRNSGWHYQLARCQQNNNDRGNAINNYTQTIVTDSFKKFPDATYYRGLANYQSGNYGTALPDYLQCQSLRLDSAFNTFDYELGNVYLNLGKYDSANICYQKILSKEAGNGWAMYGMGSVSFLKGNTDVAMGWFEKSFQTKAINSSEIKKDKLIANLRNEKNFKALMKKYY